MNSGQKCNCGGVINENDPRFEQLKEYIDSIRDSKGITMPVLQEAQRIFGFLPMEVQKFVSREIGVPLAEIYGVSTFYSQFNLTPKGKHKISVCLGTACYVKGAQAVIDKVSDELNVSVGETTNDGLFTLEATRCLGCCGLAPVMMIDEEVYAKLEDLSAIPKILEKYYDEQGWYEQ